MNPEIIKNESTNSEEVSLKGVILKMQELINYLLSKWLIIISFITFGALLGFVFVYFTKPVYTATTTFVLEEGNKSGALGSLGGLASMAGIDLGGDGGGIFQGDNILELYKSRSMIQKTLLTEVIFKGEKELLVDHYINFNGLKEKWLDEELPLKNIQFQVRKNIDTPTLASKRLMDSLIGTIVVEINKKYLVVSKPDKKLNIIRADVKGTDEFFSKAFNDQIVKNVNDFYIQTRTKKSLDNIIILQQKTDSVMAIMNNSINASAATLDATPNLNPIRQSLRAPVQRYQFSAEINKTILSELVKNLELSKIALRKETPLIQVIDQPILPLDKQKFGYLKGLVLGGFLFGFLSVIFLFLKRILLVVTK
ncbi:hypothetical protein AAKU52_000635 [Pedobacter sp. CG_S7]|uniref:Wzz/FepE/Etk N-terminal domain-containing protein n=1 Tax=Pedobacter sp. CG_S7 TaxID=3143930 RepID=UPI003395CC11